MLYFLMADFRVLFFSSFLCVVTAVRVAGSLYIRSLISSFSLRFVTRFFFASSFEPVSSTHTMARGFCTRALGSSSFYGNGAMFCEFTKVLRRSSSSHANVGLTFESSSHLDEIFDFICFLRRNSYSESWCMKVALISRSGRLLLRNSRLLSSDHLYLRMM